MRNPENLKENVGKLYDYLPEDKKEELEEILRYGKEIKERGEEKKKEFWKNHDRDDFLRLLGCERKMSSEYEEILGKMSGITREKFIEEYLHDDILYSTELTGKEEKKGWKEYRYEDLKRGGLNFGEFDYLFLTHLGIGSDLAKELSKMELKNGVTLYLNDNKIGDEGAEAISKMELKDGVYLDLSFNEIGDAGAKAIAENMELKEGVYLDLSDNEIGDAGAEAISKMELKNGVTLDLSRNEISDEMKENLKKWEQSYRDKGINCIVRF